MSPPAGEARARWWPGRERRLRCTRPRAQKKKKRRHKSSECIHRCGARDPLAGGRKKKRPRGGPRRAHGAAARGTGSQSAPEARPHASSHGRAQLCVQRHVAQGARRAGRRPQGASVRQRRRVRPARARRAASVVEGGVLRQRGGAGDAGAHGPVSAADAHGRAAASRAPWQDADPMLPRSPTSLYPPPQARTVQVVMVRALACACRSTPATFFFFRVHRAHASRGTDATPPPRPSSPSRRSTARRSPSSPTASLSSCLCTCARVTPSRCVRLARRPRARARARARSRFFFS